MSVTVQFVFNSPDDLGTVRERATATLGVELTPYLGDADDLFATFLGLEISLAICDLESDRDINFSAYRYNLTTRTAWAAAKRRAFQVEATALIAYALLSDGVAHDGVLVYETQNLLATYHSSPDSGVIDTLSGNVVAFPGHLETLRARVTRRH